MLKTKEILEAFGRVGVDRAKQLLEKHNATGKTVESVKFKVESNNERDRLTIKARPFTSALEDGIRPTSKGVSGEMIESLTEYAEARGMDKPKSAAWAIAKTIQAKGDKTYRMGGKDVYSNAMEDLTKDITKELTKDMLREIKSIL